MIAETPHRLQHSFPSFSPPSPLLNVHGICAKPRRDSNRSSMWQARVATIQARGGMTITLRPEHEKAIERAIQSGAYQNPDEVIERALEVLRSEDDWLHEHKEQIAE